MRGGGRPVRFEFATASRIVFGPGTLAQVGGFAAELGRRALVVTGASAERAAPLLVLLAEKGIRTFPFCVSTEPTFAVASEATARARETDCDLIVGFGGGSPLDSAKAVAALVTNGGEPLDYAEVIGLGKPLTRPSLPFIAIPTTAGTGTEVTRNAVLASPDHRVKVSLRSPHLLPRLALVDPELTYSLPPGPTASTGLDALTQLIEPFLSARANPMTDALAREGMRRIARSLRRACDHGGDVEAREDLSLASLFGGLVMANASLGAVHGIANPFGGMFPSPHGAVCARLLAPVMAANIRAAKERQPGSELLRRLDEVAQTLTGSAAAAADEAVVWLRDVCRALEIPPLSSYGMTPADFPDLIQRALVASSMKANPVTLTQDELRQILDEAI